MTPLPYPLLHDEIRLVVTVLAPVNLEIALARLEPRDDVAIVLKHHRKTTFAVRVEFLRRVQALFEAAEEHAADQQPFAFC